MTHRLLLVCQGPTAATRARSFPADEPLDETAFEAAVEAGSLLPAATSACTSPAKAARQTAEAMGLTASVREALREPDYGRWRGRSLAEVAAEDGEALSHWLQGEAAPPDGEALETIFERVAGWLSDRATTTGRSVAVADSSVIRAAIVLALDAPFSSFWKVDVEPLSVTALTHDGRRWALRSEASQPKT